ncbi:uncharacterized protein LOC143203222 [Rhynchophorus ferrugineus]|uniref:uncharacterized protein LOC143203222 n=1 Tax=Rhynchophorus ferrugineus TaxID=354439 RepID=UPI003FCD4701
MEKEEPVAYMTWVYLGILMTFIKYYSATASRIVYRISNLAKVVASKLVSNKFSQEEIIRNIECLTDKMLTFLSNTTTYLLNISSNLCFAVVIVLLIAKHALRRVESQNWKYYAVTVS